MTVQVVESMAHTVGKAPEEPALVRGGKDWVSSGDGGKQQVVLSAGRPAGPRMLSRL